MSTNRARLINTIVTFRNGKTYAMADAPPLEPGAVVTVPEVPVKWWQDYVTILTAVASLVTAYTGLYFIFNGNTGNWPMYEAYWELSDPPFDNSPNP